MRGQRKQTKKYSELTTLSLLEKRSEWERFGHDLPEGGLLIVAPEDNPEASRFLLKIAKSFREEGWEVEIRYFPEGPVYDGD